jgi:hypothetical protein
MRDFASVGRQLSLLAMRICALNNFNSIVLDGIDWIAQIKIEVVSSICIQNLMFCNFTKKPCEPHQI